MSGWMVVAAGNNHSEGDGFPPDAASKVKDLITAGYGLRNVVFAPDGRWLVLLQHNAYWHNGVSGDLTTQLGSMAASGFAISDVEFAPNGGWAIVAENNGYYCRNVPPAAFDAIGAGVKAGHVLKSVVFSPAGEWLIVFAGNVVTASPDFPSDCLQKVHDMASGGYAVDDVSFSPEGAWAVVADNGFWFSGGTGGAEPAAAALASAGHAVQRAAFGLTEAVVPRFPIQASQHDDLAGCGGHMDTSVTIDAQGHLNAVTHIWEDTALRGFHGGAVVVLLDAGNHPLWASQTEVLGVDGRWVGVSDRTVSWTAAVPPNVLPSTRGVAIYQTWDPSNVAGVIQQWLSGINTDSALLAGIVKSVATIVAAL